MDDPVDLETGSEGKQREKKNVHGFKQLKVQNQTLLSGVAYCLSSCAMILVSKLVLSRYDFNAVISLMLYQNFVSVVIVSILSGLGIISTEPLTGRLVQVWLPVNIIFVGMLITSMLSKHHNSKVCNALLLMIASAVSGGLTDLSFHAVGYMWQVLNCFLTASYSFTLQRIMDAAKLVTKSGNLNEFSMVLLNNILSLPLGLVLIFVFGEVDYLGHILAGSLNQIPLSIAGILMFNVPTSLENVLSISFGLSAGVFFAKAKLTQKS